MLLVCMMPRAPLSLCLRQLSLCATAAAASRCVFGWQLVRRARHDVCPALVRAVMVRTVCQTAVAAHPLSHATDLGRSMWLPMLR